MKNRSQISATPRWKKSPPPACSALSTAIAGRQADPPEAEKIKSSPGVALIMVLGVLTVMVLMAVAFSVSMRTERAAASNHADIVKARHVVYIGLARAMDQIKTEMRTNLLLPGAQVYPEWGVTNSYDNNSSYTTKVNHLYGSASNYVPLAFWMDATNANARDSGRHWINIGMDPVTNLITNTMGAVIGTNVSINLVGRVAYMIINCSGLVDANFAGGNGVPRAQGTNPNEIAIEYLPEIGTIARRATFLNDRAGHVRYETLHDLTAVNSGLSVSSNLFVYSRFPAGYWTNDGMGHSGVATGLCVTGLSRAELEAKAPAIRAAFAEAVSSDPDEAELLYRNLLEYVDDNSTPDDYEKAYVDLFPMINELAVSNVIWVQNVGGTNIYSVTNFVNIEIWNPFVLDLDGFDLSYHYNTTPLGAPPTPAPLVPADDSDVRPIPALAAGSFFVTNLPFSLQIDAFETNVFVNPISFRADIEIRVQKDGVVCDGFSAPWEFIFSQSGMTGSSTNYFRECLDPRFNWDTDPAGGQWRGTNSHTLGQTNAWTLAYLDTNPDYSARTNDGCTAMFVTNAPLSSVGELGYLCYAPWKTIKLYGTNAHRVLDVFAQGTNEVSRGLINPNTMVDDALAAVFAGMPVDAYPGGPATTMSLANARLLAGQMIIDNGPYTNLSDVFRGLTDFAGLAGLDTELHRESLVRNAAGLLNLRQNLFTILIEAQASKGAMIPSNPPKQRAVALVWRDPYTGSCFLRHIKWLDD